MNRNLTRRQFLRSSLAGASTIALYPKAVIAAEPQSFSFVLLGDLHFDKLEHHDFTWLEKNKPADLSQIRNYTRITADITPRLFATVRETISDLKQSTVPPAFVLQVGDLVEGLCGTEELATRQNQEAAAFVGDAKLGAPFLFTKGNHDVTGDGATAAFKTIFHPFMAKELSALGDGKLSKANYAFSHSGAMFCCFDAYDKESLDWLEAALAKRTARHCFVVIHPPVVPYGARSTWHIYSNPKDKPKRDKLLELLGKQRVFVLGGHIHKFNTLVRSTGGGGQFVQLAISSIINSPKVKPKDVLSGTNEYNGDQIRVEPNFSPETQKERKGVYEAERPFVKKFDYADLPGYAVVTVNGSNVEAKIFSGASGQLWRTLQLSTLLAS